MRAVLLLAAAVIVALPACSDDDSTDESTTTVTITTSSSTTTAPSVDRSSTSNSTSVPDSTTTPQVATTESPTEGAPSSTLLPAETSLPPQGSISENERGEPVTLDETATLACALAEFARDALVAEDVERALSFLDDAAQRAESSSVPDVAQMAPALANATADDAVDTVSRFLDICVEHGHQI